MRLKNHKKEIYRQFSKYSKMMPCYEFLNPEMGHTKLTNKQLSNKLIIITMTYNLNLNIRRIKSTLIVLLTILCYSLLAQDEFKNHQKYWFLRSKLRNDLMKVGLNQGESIPFAQRGIYSNINFDSDDINYTGKLHGGDLISELGIYVGALATEYKLLKMNNQNTDSTRYELYCALNAVNRLDYNAEPLYGSYSNSLDGFLIRDDIPKDFVLNNYKHFNYYNTWDGTSTVTKQTYGKPLDNFQVPTTTDNDRGFLSIIQRGQWEVGSVYYDNYQYKKEHPDDVAEQGNVAMSQDHLISLMYGLRLVSEYVDPNANWNNQGFLFGESGISSILQEAEAISDRLVKNLKSHHWQLKKPDGTDVSNHEGGDAHVYAYALAQIAGKINQPNTSVDNWPSLSPVPMVDQAYHDAHTKALGFQEFQFFAKSPGITFDLITQIGELNAACQCLFNKLGGNMVTIITVTMEKIWKWLGTVFGWILNIIVNTINYTIPISWTNHTDVASLPNALTLNTNALKSAQRIKYRQDYALITNMLLQNKRVNFMNYGSFLNAYNNVLSRTSDILNSAPCTGPYNFSNHRPASLPGGFETKESYDVYEWSGYSLIEHANSMGTDNLDYNAQTNTNTYQLNTGEYNGLDYMLYHNLYYLYKASLESEGDGLINLRERYVNYSLPLPDGYCSNSNPGTIGAFEYIIASGTVNSNSSVSFRAGKQFGVQPGSEYAIVPGANVGIEISPYNCSDDYRNQAMRTTTNPTSGDSTDMYGSMGNSHKTHYEAYPKDQQKKNILDNRYPKKDSKTFSNSTITNLNDQVTVYPNPNDGNFRIKLNVKDNQTTYSVSIYNIIGDLVKICENITASDNTISIQEPMLTQGAYLLKITCNSNGKQSSEKIIIKQ